MDSLGLFTRQEILSQPEVWADVCATVQQQSEQLRHLYQEGQFDSVIFTGCGSPYYLAQHLASVMQELGQITARAVPASELWLAPELYYPAAGRTLLVALSRSGTTTETLRACESFVSEGKGALVTLVCYPDTPLSKLGQLNLVFPAAREESFAQTRAFTGLQVGGLAAIAIWTGQSALEADLARLPGYLSKQLGQYGALAKDLGSDPRFERFYFLGSGARYGLASELALKMKEMSLSHSEPFHFMEFRHGPQTMVNEQTLVLGLLSEKQRSHEQAVLDEMAARGARVVAVGAEQAELAFGTGLASLAESPLYLPFGQLMALEHAVSKGLNPDRPSGLEMVIILPDA
jgi:glucosamine--fructose-6-phosphate aminotransferase (isomerizing)